MSKRLETHKPESHELKTLLFLGRGVQYEKWETHQRQPRKKCFIIVSFVVHSSWNFSQKQNVTAKLLWYVQKFPGNWTLSMETMDERMFPIFVPKIDPSSPGIYHYFKSVISEHVLHMKFIGTPSEIVLTWIPKMISQHWCRQWLGAARQHIITRSKVDPDICVIWRHWTTMC